MIDNGSQNNSEFSRKSRAKAMSAELLERLWVEQLSREHENIAWRHRVKLRTPLIEVCNMNGRWGSWDPVLRVIRISRRLIDEYSWDIVLEILKHEMAHQLVTDDPPKGRRSADERPHGDAFQSACQRLGLSDWASNASGELPEQIPVNAHRVLAPEDERLLRRIEKLLALANSTNEHESLLAMERVRELYARHNIDRIRQKVSSDQVHLIINRRRKVIDSVETAILGLLGEFFFVRVITGSMFDAATGETFKIAEILGSRANVAMAEYVHSFLLHCTTDLWASYRAGTVTGPRPGSGRIANLIFGSGRSAPPRQDLRARRSYQLGLLAGFRRKLEQSADDIWKRTETELGLAAETRQLIVTHNEVDLDRHVARRHPRLMTRQTSTRRVVSAHFEAGRVDGGRITLLRPITSSGPRASGKLLGPG